MNGHLHLLMINLPRVLRGELIYSGNRIKYTPTLRSETVWLFKSIKIFFFHSL